ncbi:hypothetical protein ACP70R_022909 [Stipagrostis hirtigluma subsp. patula]
MGPLGQGAPGGCDGRGGTARSHRRRRDNQRPALHNPLVGFMGPKSQRDGPWAALPVHPDSRDDLRGLYSLHPSRAVYQKSGNIFFRKSVKSSVTSEQSTPILHLSDLLALPLFAIVT